MINSQLQALHYLPPEGDIKHKKLNITILNVNISVHYRKYDRMPQDEQARSLMGEWSNFADNGEKI